MNVIDVTVEQRDDGVGVVCTHQSPFSYFGTNLIPAVATAYEELGGSGRCRAIVLASEGRVATLDIRQSDSAGFAEGVRAVAERREPRINGL
jgi:hypothetical protein